jgi:hypothetical protein
VRQCVINPAVTTLFSTTKTKNNTMSSSSGRFLPQARGKEGKETAQISNYGPPPGGYSPDIHVRVARHYETESRQHNNEHHGGRQYQNNPSQQPEPGDQFSFTYSSHGVPQRNHDSRNSSPDQRPSQQGNRPWNKWGRPRSPKENLGRNVRSRTASLTGEEEQQVAEPNAITSESTSVISSRNAHIEPPASHHQESEGSKTEANDVRALEVVSSTLSDPAALVSVSSSTESAAFSVPNQPADVVSSQAPAAVPSAAISDNSEICPFFYHETEGEPMAFCCAKCQCPPERVERYGVAISTGAEGDYYHRHCCHNISQEEVSENWLPPFQNLQDTMQNKLYEALEKEEGYPVPEPKIESSLVVANRARMNTETQVRNNGELLCFRNLFQHQNVLAKLAKPAKSHARCFPFNPKQMKSNSHLIS